MQQAELLDRFQGGEWVNLKPDLHSSLWRIMAGNWTVEDNEWITLQSKVGSPLLLCQTRFGRRFEVLGEIRFKEKAMEGVNAAISFGPKDRAVRSTFRVYLSPGRAGIFHGRQALVVDPISVKVDNAFRVQCWDGKLTTYLNESPLRSAVKVDGQGEDEHALVGIGGEYCFDGAVLQFRNLKVRLLKEPPKKAGAVAVALPEMPTPAVSAPSSHLRQRVGIAGVLLLTLFLLGIVIQRRRRMGSFGKSLPAP